MHTGPFDVLIRGAMVFDGAGNPWFLGDVGLKGERIAAVAPAGLLKPEGAREVVEAAGLAVCPGFIDIQSHSITTLMNDGRCVSKLTQGVTTEIMGETWVPAPHGGKCGPLPAAWREKAKGWTRFRHWFDALLEAGVSPNVGSFFAAGTLRSLACGMRMGAPAPDELERMKTLLDEAMADGAFGISYALIYPPDCYVETAEIVEIAKVAARRGGLYITHMRSESDRLLEGVEEALEIGRRAGLPVEIYHLKAAGKANWPKMAQAIARIDAARAEGQDVTACMYPYVASGTGLSTQVPAWAAADDLLFKNVADPQVRPKLRAEMLGRFAGANELGARAEGIMPVGFRLPEHRGYIGKRLSQIAAERGQEWVDAVLDLLASEGHDIFTIFFSMSERNLQLQLRQPWIKVASDAGGTDPARAGGLVHPRGYGTFTRVLGHYARDLGVLSFEEAVRKMSGAVAARLGLADRGILRAGAWADVVLFDPKTVADRATFEEPHRLSVGVQDVWVNGTKVVSNGEHTGAKPGKFVAGPGAEA
ncbi:MAG: D-aminoacylase [Planctomycetota bacterium]|nr:D-aminoacylase [Planctomycetota bacterium]